MTELIVVTYGGGESEGASRRQLDDVLQAVRESGGSVLRTALSSEQEERLTTTLRSAGLLNGAGSAHPESEAATSASPPSRPDLSSSHPGDPDIGATPAALGTGVGTGNLPQS
jgi:hypothetical protein